MGVFTEYATSSDQKCALRWTQSGRGRKADHKQLERMMKVKHLQLYVSHLAKNASKSSLVSLRNKMFENRQRTLKNIALLLSPCQSVSMYNSWDWRAFQWKSWMRGDMKKRLWLLILNCWIRVYTLTEAWKANLICTAWKTTYIILVCNK